MRTFVPASSGGAKLCVETFGAEGDPVVLLIGGNGWSMDHWDTELCELLAARGLFVVRYDHRDTGESTASPPGEPGYTSRDLTEDAIAVLDGVDIARAHVVGLSMGGGILQELALAHRDRVLSITLMSTGFARDQPDGLPGPGDIAEPPPPDWSDRAAVVDYLVAIERAYAGPDAFDPERARAIAERVAERTANIESAMRNHMQTESGAAVPGRFADLIGIPALVVHGTADPMFPIDHGRALASALDAPLLELEGVGHQLPPVRDWNRFADALVKLVSGA